MAIEKSFRISPEKFSVGELAKKYHKEYETIIVTYQSKVLEGLIDKNLVSEMVELRFGSSHSMFPIYRINNQAKILFFLCPIGAPTAVGILEEIAYSLSIKNIVMYGSCGVLDKSITEGKIIVPTKAYRDEGTSYHYKPASDFIDIPNSKDLVKILADLNIDYVTGFTWTTDGFYRETEELFLERKTQGCICVEMEVSAVQAFSDLRGLQFYSFLYGADNLDATKWDKRILGNLDLDERIKFFLLALNIAKSITT